jgi:hypothetical protein
MKLYKTIEIKCSSCYGKGYVFYGDRYDYSIEPCECVANG